MNYQFDQVIDRSDTTSIKWGKLEQLFGSEDILPMWVADMDFQAPPEVMEAVKKRAEHGIYGYTFRSDQYYKGIIDWQKKRHGWEVDEKWITSSPGVVTALSILVDVLSEPGDRVVLQSPVYYPFYDVISKNQREVVKNPLILENSYYHMDFELLEQQVKDERTKLLLLCNPHNPGGRVWKEDELRKLGEICLKHDVIVISDEIHGDLVYKGHRHIPFASLSEEIAQNCVICTAPSKTFNLAGLQASTIFIPSRKIRRLYNNRLKALSLHMENFFGAVAMEACYASGEPWLEQLIDYLQRNLEYSLDYIQRNIPDIKPMKPEGTYLLWMDCRKLSTDSTEIKKFMYKEAKIAFNEGSTFGDEGAGFLRLNLACPRSILVEGLKRFEQAVKLRLNNASTTLN